MEIQGNDFAHMGHSDSAAFIVDCVISVAAVELVGLNANWSVNKISGRGSCNAG